MPFFKKIKIIIIVILVVSAPLILFACTAHHISSPINPVDGIIRLHIIANSNNSGDIATKLTVRDNVLDFLNGELVHLTDVNTAMRYIRGRLNQITGIANRVLMQSGSNQRATSRFGVTHFPTIAYQSGTLQAGYYNALIIYLGAGAGSNWWCVIYPPLCFLPSTNQTGGEGIRYRSFIWDRVSGR